MKLDETLKEHSYSAVHKWFYRFIYRNSFSISKITHIGQSAKYDSKEQLEKHFKLLYEIIYKSNIMDKLDLITNMDETPYVMKIFIRLLSRLLEPILFQSKILIKISSE